MSMRWGAALAWTLLATAQSSWAAPPGAGAEAAYRTQAAAAEARPDDADLAYRLGLAALDAGHVPQAIVALQRALALRPDFAQARAEIARAYAMAGDIDTARAQFDTVLADPTLPDPVRQRFAGIVAGLDRQISGKGENISGFIDVAAGHDSNTNSATSLTQVTIPIFAVFGPGTLSGTARALDDSYAEVRGGISAVEGINRTDRVFASVLGGYRGNGHARLFNQGDATVTLGYAHTLANKDSLSLAGQVQQFWLNDVSYRQTYALVGQYTHPLGEGRALALSAQYARLSYRNQPLYSVDHLALGATLSTRSWVLAGDMGHEFAATGSTQSNWFANLSLAWEAPLAHGLAVNAALAGGARAYDRADSLFLTHRQDWRLDASLGLKALVTPQISLRPRVTYTRNASNIPLYDFDRWTAGAGLRAEF
ncbi:MAG: DUF560 domain-containing protein [Proteobacteria bacterium]|nr:DUF560 domain-containing protein [Pseudomonadota bacterium]